jgi:hypothetical protein
MVKATYDGKTIAFTLMMPHNKDIENEGLISERYNSISCMEGVAYDIHSTTFPCHFGIQ